MATALFILLYVQDERSYDKYNDKYQRIYRLESDFTINNEHKKYAVVPIPLGPALKNEFPEIEQFVRIDLIGNLLFKYNDREFYEENFYLADSSVFDVFSYSFVYGNPRSSLTEPNSIVITRSIGDKYFRDENPLGKILTSGEGTAYKVTGVIEDLPGNSHLKFDALISAYTKAPELPGDDYSTMKPSRFWRIGAFTYILLKKNTTIDGVLDKFPAFYDKYMKELGDKYNLSFALMATPLADTHFRQGLSGERPTGNKAYILIFSAVAIFILLLASINYMNMATARSSNRAREIGMRKVLGAYKSQLRWQFLSESVVLAMVSMLIAVLIVFSLLPEFNNLTDKTISVNFLHQPVLLIEIIFIGLIVGVLSGSYPAFYLAAFRPVFVLKGAKSKTGKKSGLLRRVLVIFQFFIAIFMIAGALVVSGQMRFLKNKDLGFNKNDLVVLEIQDSSFRERIQSFKDELLSNPDILDVTNSTGIPGRINWIQMMRIEQENKMEERAILLAQTDYDYAKTLGLEFVKGRDFDKNMGTDALESVIINETAADEFGWSRDPIGKKIHFGFRADGTGGRNLKVIGVVKDFNFKSLHNAIEPVIFFISEYHEYFLTCRVKEGHEKDAIDFMEQKWNEFGTNRPFSYRYLTDMLDEVYKSDEQIGVIIRITTILALLIALLGLLGLSSFIATQKTKEIGLRKILGAGIGNILLLMYRDFAYLILIAFIIAVPAAWWQLDTWLEENFVYHIPLQWSVFLFTGLIAFIIGLGTISFHIIRVASKNPVEAIKYE